MPANFISLRDLSSLFLKKLIEFYIWLPIRQQDFSVSRGKKFLIELLIPGLLFPFIVVKKCYLRSGVWLFPRFLEIIVKIIKDVFFSWKPQI